MSISSDICTMSNAFSMDETEFTTISLSKANRDALASLGNYDDTFDSIIGRVIKYVQANKDAEEHNQNE